jgi:hypothetical protein
MNTRQSLDEKIYCQQVVTVYKRISPSGFAHFDKFLVAVPEELGIDQREISPRLHVVLFEGGRITLTHTLAHPFSSAKGRKVGIVLTHLDANETTILLDFLDSHTDEIFEGFGQGGLQKYAEAASTITIEDIATDVDDQVAIEDLGPEDLGPVVPPSPRLAWPEDPPPSSQETHTYHITARPRKPGSPQDKEPEP